MHVAGQAIELGDGHRAFPLARLGERGGKLRAALQGIFRALAGFGLGKFGDDLETLGLREGQQTKMELVYQYLTGPRFRHRIEAVVERFGDMQADLDRERKTMMRLWAKREEQIRGVVESTAGLYGDLQGIAGRSLLEIDGLELPLLDGPSAADAAE